MAKKSKNSKNNWFNHNYHKDKDKDSGQINQRQKKRRVNTMNSNNNHDNTRNPHQNRDGGRFTTSPIDIAINLQMDCLVHLKDELQACQKLEQQNTKRQDSIIEMLIDEIKKANELLEKTKKQLIEKEKQIENLKQQINQTKTPVIQAQNVFYQDYQTPKMAS